MLHSLFGLFGLLAIAWALSENRRLASLKVVLIGVAFQFALAVVLLKLPAAKEFFGVANKAVLALQDATQAGASFVFGYLGGAALPFEEGASGSSFILAFRALPLVLVMSALSALLFYWRVLPLVVRAMAWVLQRTFGIGGALGVGAAANIFVGMVESPLLVRPYLAAMTRSELFALMTCGMATIAGTMMVLYVTVVGTVIPDAAGHLIVASLISAPAALTIAYLMVPETAEGTGGGFLPVQTARSSIDAVARGTADGVRLLVHIVAMLVVLVALVHLVNGGLGAVTVAGAPLSLQRLLGWILSPVAFLMGIPWGEARTAGSLLGIKTVLNEFLAYLELAALSGDELSVRSRVIMTYALCGFANLGSLGIMLGGMGVMVPERRDEIVSLGVKSVVAGTLATCMTGAVVGILY